MQDDDNKIAELALKIFKAGQKEINKFIKQAIKMLDERTHSEEDLAQDAFLGCIEGVKKYKATKSKVLTLQNYAILYAKKYIFGNIKSKDIYWQICSIGGVHLYTLDNQEFLRQKKTLKKNGYKCKSYRTTVYLSEYNDGRSNHSKEEDDDDILLNEQYIDEFKEIENSEDNKKDEEIH